MPNSTSTLLDVVNRVLLNSGERAVTTLSAPIGVLATSCVVDACTEVSHFNEWTFLQQNIPAQSWVQDEAFLGDIQALHGVSVGNETTGFRALTHLRREAFDSQSLVGYDDTQIQQARNFSMRGYNTVKVNPYPTGATGKLEILFDVSITIICPPSASGVFPVPERFIPLIVSKATELFLVRHLTDVASSQSEQQHFISMAATMRARERNVSTRTLSMYRGR